MLAIRVEYLTGRCVATAFNDRGRAEWPPHPARLFSALVDAWAADGSSDPLERAALEWLEALDPPALTASGADERRAVPVYVPVNDATVIGDPAREREKVARARHDLEVAEVAVSGGNASKVATRSLVKARAALEKGEAALSTALATSILPDAKPSSTMIAVARTVLPERRVRQQRTFPSVTPHDPVVYFRWDAQPDATLQDTLARLLRRVTRLGHSSSFVACSLAAEPPDPTWVPHAAGEQMMRTTAVGQLARLEQEYASHRAVEPRTLPCRFVRYADPARLARAAGAPRSLFGDDWIVLRRVGGPRLPSIHAVAVAEAVRGALLRHAGHPSPAVLSGHELDGSALARPHLAVVPLPSIGHDHADGALLGVALVLPSALPPEERTAVLRALAKWEDSARIDDEEAPVLEVLLGPAGVLEVERVAWGAAQLSALRAATWCGPAREWITATPIALDRNPGDLHARDAGKAETAYQEAAAIVARSCENVGLPLPQAVTILPSVTLRGTAKARRFPSFPNRPDRVQRVKVHAVVRFAEPVRGPVLLGAGRFLGLGLMRPVREEG